MKLVAQIALGVWLGIVGAVVTVGTVYFDSPARTVRAQN